VKLFDSDHLWGAVAAGVVSKLVEREREQAKGVSWRVSLEPYRYQLQRDPKALPSQVSGTHTNRTPEIRNCGVVHSRQGSTNITHTTTRTHTPTHTSRIHTSSFNPRSERAVFSFCVFYTIMFFENDNLQLNVNVCALVALNCICGLFLSKSWTLSNVNCTTQPSFMVKCYTELHV
jgi:hypothetical protein